MKFNFFTLGGRFRWEDIYNYHDWRIQRNIQTGKYRLLDPNDILPTMTLLYNLASFKYSYQLKDIQTYYLPSGVLALHNGFFLYNKIIASIEIQIYSLIISKSISVSRKVTCKASI